MDVLRALLTRCCCALARRRKVEEERLKAIAMQEERERQLHEGRLRGARILQVRRRRRRRRRQLLPPSQPLPATMAKTKPSRLHVLS
jgi:hypothetical protein